MALDDLALISRRARIRLAVLAVLFVGALVWAAVHYVKPPPRRIVLASGPESGVYHQYAQKYVQILARQGVVVQERMTGGAVDNLRLLLDPKSGVDVALLQAGVATFPEADDLVMLASLYHEPLWIFYRGTTTLTKFNQLHGKRIAVGIPGSGTRALADRLLAANGLLMDNGLPRGNTEIAALGGQEAVDALKEGVVDAVLFVGGAQAPFIQKALRDPWLRLMSLEDAAAYPRNFRYLSELTLPAGTIDLAINLPGEKIHMIGTKAMLVARADFHSALINLLIDAAREIHGEQGYFETAGEFPGTARVDLPVSPEADQHKRFGPSFLYHYLPFWVATFVERAIIILVPLIVIVVPLMNLLPGMMRWRVRSRVFRWYGELVTLERDVHTRHDALPISKWLQDLDRIERAVENLRIPTAYASEAYTLREHIALVRRTVLHKGGEVAAGNRAPAAPDHGT